MMTEEIKGNDIFLAETSIQKIGKSGFRGKSLALKKRLTKSLYTSEWEALLGLLKELREAQGLTQEQLAKKLGRPQSMVSKIEAGERKLDVVQFIDYLQILDADPVAAMRRLVRAIQKP